MAFEETGESTSIFGSIGDSFKGMLTGVVLFPLSLFLIFQVETCEQASAALKSAVPAAQAKPGVASYVTGKLSADLLGGEFVKPGKYISYSQSSEVYAWKETSKENSTTKKKDYDCELEWISSPQNPKNFKDSVCKSKPFYQATVDDKRSVASDAKVKTDEGKTYNVNLSKVDLTSAVPSVNPGSGELSKGIAEGDYIYLSQKCASDQAEGCERISVSLVPVPEENMTFVGSVNGNTIGEFTSEEGNKFLNASVGDFQTTMKDIQSDDNTEKWLMRLGCFIAMWVSFNLLAGPLLSLLSFVPLVGELGKTALSIVFGVVAFVITAVTILLVKFWYIWLILGLAAIGYAIYKKKAATA
ncbi:MULTISPECIES: TMEM43 family protein [unclassified Leptospira]|uniref:TMEM43 family protein n=1 Tax=unclassified Leptospira TaxID=2633828 RepID=UPI0002BD7EF5|nr:MULTISPECIES: TMEM43 family protein [unclassified Leptospira]EMJ97116.1 PF07787 family protein [Leptospira sp. B5-022]MCR1793189.1 TMEM43 family protein [Leptospira sp. id769339]